MDRDTELEARLAMIQHLLEMNIANLLGHGPRDLQEGILAQYLRAAELPRSFPVAGPPLPEETQARMVEMCRDAIERIEAIADGIRNADD